MENSDLSADRSFPEFVIASKLKSLLHDYVFPFFIPLSFFPPCQKK